MQGNWGPQSQINPDSENMNIECQDYRIHSPYLFRIFELSQRNDVEKLST